MKFSSSKEIIKAVAKIRAESKGKKCTFSLRFKKAVCVFISESDTHTIHFISGITEISGSVIYNWMVHFKAGDYKESSGYKVCKALPKSNKNLLEQLQQKLEEIKHKISVIKDCESLGLTVS